MTEYQPAPPPGTPYESDPAVSKTPVLSILALIFGILGVLSGWFFVGFFPALAGVILGFVARRKEPVARGLWLTGIITGFVGIALAVVVVVLYIAAIVYVANNRGFSTSP